MSVLFSTFGYGSAELLWAFWESPALYTQVILKIEFSEHWNMVLLEFSLWNLLPQRHFQPSREGKAASNIPCVNKKGNQYPYCTLAASRWCFAPFWLSWVPWMPLPWLTLDFLHNCNNSYHSCLTLLLPQVWEGFLTVSGANLWLSDKLYICYTLKNEYGE